jgi:hypothetical protein
MLEWIRRGNARLDLGAIGLGVGTVGAYCGPTDTVTFVEIDSQVITIAEQQFAFLAAARRMCSSVEVRLGDARVVMRREADEAFNVLIADAFSSDWIPVHLMTREALMEFSRVLKPSGVIAYHVSGRQFDLAPLLVAAAQELHLSSVVISDPAGDTDRNSTTWVFITKGSAIIGQLRSTLLDPSGPFTERAVETMNAWTDQRRSLIAAFRR